MKDMTFSTFNPFLQKKIKTYTYDSNFKINKKIHLSSKAQEKWAQLSFAERLTILNQMKSYLIDQTEVLAKQATLEMGKTYSEALSEIKKTIQIFDFLNDENTLIHLKPMDIRTSQKKILQVRRQALGLVLIIMPWNFPYWQVYRMALPALLMGNGIILKHADITAGCALLIQKSFDFIFKKELKGLFSQVFASHDQVKAVVSDKKIKAVSLTGSAKAGQSVAALAGANLKKVVLELGGSDPYLILPDADLNLAAKACAASRLINNGQSCIAAKRFIVHQSVYNEFLDLFVAEFEKLSVGDPNLSLTALGPLAHPRFVVDLKKRIHNHNKNKNWKLVYQKKMNEVHNGFFSPHIFEVKMANAFYNEEFFAPLSLVYKANSVEKMISLVNTSAFGLGAAVFSQDRKLYLSIAAQLEVGMIAFNDFLRSDVFAPFGGVKNSGYGRELGLEGLTEMSFIQTLD